MLAFSRVRLRFPHGSYSVTTLGGRALAAAGPTLSIGFPTLASFLWYAHRPHIYPLGLFCIGRSLLSILGATAEPKQQLKSSSATQTRQPTSRSTATRFATSGFIFLQLLGLGSAEEFSEALPSASSTLSVLALVLVAGLVVFGECCQLISPVVLSFFATQTVGSCDTQVFYP